MIAASLTLADFDDRIGECFSLVEAGDPPVLLSLIEAKALRFGGGSVDARAPFALLFRSPDPRVFEQETYTLRHAAMGDLPIFIVPVAKDADGVSYEATFN